MSYVNHDYLRADRSKEAMNFNCRIEASLDDANFTNGGVGATAPNSLTTYTYETWTMT
jgi:hypothetical protein